MSYLPTAIVTDDKNLREYLNRELKRVSTSLADNAAVVFYRPIIENEHSLSAADSANYKININANVIRISTSSTLTLTGFADKTPMRERVFFNVGTGVLVFKSNGSESSASLRFLMPTDWNISANACAIFWYDPVSSRHRGLSRTS